MQALPDAPKETGITQEQPVQRTGMNQANISKL